MDFSPVSDATPLVLNLPVNTHVGLDDGPEISSLTVQQSGSGFFWDTTIQTAGARVVIDATGAVHAAYNVYTADSQGKYPAYYGYCLSSCSQPNQWTIATIGDGESEVERVHLAMDSGGRPRMVLYSRMPGGGYRWQYAACDAGCSDGANWTVITLIDLEWIDVYVYDHSLRNFALNPKGRPRLIYFDENRPDHVGTFYAFCDADCTTPANWDEILLPSSLFDDESLVFTTSGSPRFSAAFFTGNEDVLLVYAACEASCTDAANWYMVTLAESGSGGDQSQVLRLDLADRPRLAFYPGPVPRRRGWDAVLP